MTNFQRVISFLLIAAVLSQPGCDLILGLEKGNPPEPYSQCLNRVSTCRIDPPSTVIATGLTTTEVAAAFFNRDTDIIRGITWRQASGNHGEIFFATVDETGAFAMEPVKVSDGNTCFFPDIAASGVGFAMAWHQRGEYDDYAVHFTYVDGDGVTTAADRCIVDSPGTGLARFPAMTWSGNRFGIVWQDSRSGEFEIWFNLVDMTGGTILPVEQKISQLSGNSERPHIAWSGSEYAVVYVNDDMENGGVFLSLISEDGTVRARDIPVYQTDGKSDTPKIVYRSPAGYGVTWADNGQDNWEIFFTRLDENGSPLLEGGYERVSRCTGDSKNPDIATSLGPQNEILYNICWKDNRHNGIFGIFVASLDSSGQKLTHEGRVSETSTAASKCEIVSFPDQNALFWAEGVVIDEDIYFSSFSCVD